MIVPVAIYTRVSTDNQVGGRFDSCESQAAICREHIRKHEGDGWQEVACYTDAAYSGSTMNRPGIRGLQRQIEAGEVKVVVIFKLERVLRSTDEWTPFRAFLQKNGCRLVSATEDLSEETPSGRLKNNLLVSVAEYERLNTAETRAKMLEQAKRGLWNGGMVPFGYAYDEKTQTLHPHPEEGPIARRIFEQAAKLVRLTDLANALNGAGLRTKVRVMHRRDGEAENVGGRLFRSDGLRLIIQNPIYRGAVKFGGKEYPGQHEALVPATLWEKANAATLATEPRPDAWLQSRDKHNHLLKGLAHCGDCLRAMIPQDGGKKDPHGQPYRYYVCGRVLRERQVTECKVGRLSADAFEKVVITFLGEACRNPLIVDTAVLKSEVLKKKDRVVLQMELDPLKAALVKVAQQSMNCVAAVENGTNPLGSFFKKRINDLASERQRLLVEIERKTQEIAACDTALLNERRIRTSMERFGTLLPNLTPAEQKEFVQLFVENIDVRSHAPRHEPTGPRVLTLIVRLRLPRLVEGMEERAWTETKIQRVRSTVNQRGVTFTARVDFERAPFGEVSILSPFQRVVRLDTRLRTLTEHTPVDPINPMVRAKEWNDLLESGEVPNRVELAKRMGVTPGAVTRVLRLIKLLPEIQEFLAALKSSEEVWHYNQRLMGNVARLPATKQSEAFTRVRRSYRQARGVRIG